MRGYEKLQIERKVDLTRYLGHGDELGLRKQIGFGMPALPEDLHYEQSYEFLIPQDRPLTVRVCPDDYRTIDKGSADDGALSRFDSVVVEPGEMVVIYPGHCHRVVDKGRFVVLKVEGRFKVLAKPDPLNPGCCTNHCCSLWPLCERIGVDNTR